MTLMFRMVTMMYQACVHVLQVMQGMVFVWGESGPQAAAEADAMPVPGLPDLEQSEAKPMRSKSGQPMKNFIKSYYRELPYGWDVLAENLQDPCKHRLSALEMLCWRRCGRNISECVQSMDVLRPYGSEDAETCGSAFM